MQYGPIDGIIHLEKDRATVYMISKRACGSQPIQVASWRGDAISRGDIYHYFPLGPIELKIKTHWMDEVPEDFPVELVWIRQLYEQSLVP
jgi:hypothetical protein